MNVGELLRLAGKKRLMDSTPGSMQAVAAVNMLLPADLNLEASSATGLDVLTAIEALDDAQKIKLLNLEIIPPADSKLDETIKSNSILVTRTICLMSFVLALSTAYTGLRNLTFPEWEHLIIPFIGPMMMAWQSNGVLKSQTTRKILDQVATLPGGEKIKGFADAFISDEDTKEKK